MNGQKETFEVEFVSDQKTALFTKGKRYIAHLPKDDHRGIFYCVENDDGYQCAVSVKAFKVIQ